MNYIPDMTTVVGLLLVAVLAIAGIVKFRVVVKKKARRKSFQDF